MERTTYMIMIRQCTAALAVLLVVPLTFVSAETVSVRNSVSIQTTSESSVSVQASARSAQNQSSVSVETVVNGEVVESFHETKSGSDAEVFYEKTTDLPDGIGTVSNSVAVHATTVNAEAASRVQPAEGVHATAETSAGVATAAATVSDDGVKAHTSIAFGEVDGSADSESVDASPEKSTNPMAVSQVAQVDTVPTDHGVLLFIKRFIAYVSSFFG